MSLGSLEIGSLRKAMDRAVTYVGKDLESMDHAENYHRWILDVFRPYLGRRIVEVGAGTGGFSKLLLEIEPDHLTLVEPSRMFDELIVNVNVNRGAGERTTLNTYNNTFRLAANSIAETRPDTVVYVNVLEHIEDDAAELSAVHSVLDKGGKCLIFVPAFMALYGKFDEQVGHYRRYSKFELEAKCRAAGFRIVKSSFFDLVGFFPWWIKYRLLRSSSLGSSAVKIYDRVVVPVASRVEPITGVPFGKNLIVVAEK